MMIQSKHNNKYSVNMDEISKRDQDAMCLAF